MRAPAEAQGAVGLECASAELAYALRTDPIELRLRNFAETHETALPCGPQMRVKDGFRCSLAQIAVPSAARWAARHSG